MILNIHTNASYLSEREAKSREGGGLYMVNNTDKTNKLTNGETLIISTYFKHVMSCHRQQKQKQTLVQCF
jgi:hypothetical protein